MSRKIKRIVARTMLGCVLLGILILLLKPIALLQGWIATIVSFLIMILILCVVCKLTVILLDWAFGNEF